MESNLQKMSAWPKITERTTEISAGFCRHSLIFRQHFQTGGIPFPPGKKWKQLSRLSWFNTRLGKFWERHCGTLMFARAQRHRHLNIARTFENNSFCNWNVNIRNQGVRIIDLVSTDRSSKIKEKARSFGFHSNISVFEPRTCFAGHPESPPAECPSRVIDYILSSKRGRFH